jgi:Rha family phage regulatory protein
MTNTLPPEIFPHVEIIDNVAVTTSLEIARHFNRSHHEIVANIESLNIFALLIKSNFHKIPNCETTTYYVTKDGLFLLLLFGFSCRDQPYELQTYILAFDYVEEPKVDLPNVSVESSESLMEESAPLPIEYPQVQIVNGVAMTTSLDVAQYFDKRHDHILRDIRSLEVSDSFRVPNFGESSYLNQQGKQQPMYHLTKDGFIFLVMGFTGEKAAQIKEAYIAAFNRMEAELTRHTRKDLTILLVATQAETEQLETQYKGLQEKCQRMCERITRETIEMVSRVYRLCHEGFSEQEIVDITHYQKDIIKLALSLKAF